MAERKCIASGEVDLKDNMLRFVVGPNDQVVFDAKGKLPGRGLWLSARQDMLEMACAKKKFARAARARVVVPDDLVDQVVHQLQVGCLNRIGLARRAGILTQGYDNVRAALKNKPEGVLLHASDGALDGREKITRLAPDVQVVALFTAEDIGHAIGRDNAVHTLIGPGKMAKIFLSEACKLAGLTHRSLNGILPSDGPKD
ncbi:MAG: RNA-binding protein [Magnetovibrio sp.]|nr:RNA-binding protein [Magnetovibrio sp.]